MRLTRRQLMSASAGVLASPAAAQNSDRRPNIVFVIADDLRYDGLGCTGHPFVRTPNLDRIAREGATFDNFFCTTPLCSPSRASFLTGLYAHTHRIINNDKMGLAEISHSLQTFPRFLYDEGYETAFIGKWHMGFDDTRRPGFDYWVGFRGQGQYINPVVNVNGERRQLRGYMTDFLNREAVDFVKRPRQKPFAMYVAHKAVHNPYLPAPRHDKLYADARFEPPRVAPGDLDGKPAMRLRPGRVDVLHMEGAVPEPGESRRGRGREPREIVLDQARCLTSVDDGMGMLFEALESTGQLDNTLIVFTSDNGYLMGEHNKFDDKRWPYEPSMHLPLVMRYPRLIKAGSRRKQLALNIDIAPTVLDLAGVKPMPSLHGRSLVPVLRDEQASLRESLLAEYFVEKVVPGVPDWQAVRTDHWKYIHYPALRDMDELYDLSADRGEEKNLIHDAAHRGVLSEMKLQLGHLLQESGAH